MKKILLQYFPSLDNYGTAMMGLVTAQFLSDHFGGDVEIHADLNSDEIIPEVTGELRGSVPVRRFTPPRHQQIQRSRGLLRVFRQLSAAKGYGEFDLVLVLAGDGISEYYGRWNALVKSLIFYFQRFHCPVVLVGQTLGPFHLFRNRLLLPRLLRRIPVFTRDQWSHDYLQEEWQGKQNLHQGADLAFCDLPLQHDRSIEREILERYHLVPDRYVTVIVSGLVKQYCTDRRVYFRNWHEILCRLAVHPRLREKQICLLAHTFANYGDEGAIIAELVAGLPEDLRQRVVPVTERMLPTRARCVLGNGYLTITGRMHASISTFQMGKPAIVLSYSKKYEGIIGRNLNRPDLILEAGRNDALWENCGSARSPDGTLADRIDEKVRYICENYDRLTGEIRKEAAVQKQQAESMLQQCVAFVR